MRKYNFGKSCVDPAKQLWQIMFDLYVAKGCPTERMDNMLIDYENCQKLMAKGGGTFLWCFNESDSWTTWMECSPEEVHDLAVIRMEDCVYLIEVLQDECTVEVVTTNFLRELA